MINSCNAQMEVVFPWPGPLVVPVDNTIVEQGSLPEHFLRGGGGGVDFILLAETKFLNSRDVRICVMDFGLLNII